MAIMELLVRDCSALWDLRGTADALSLAGVALEGIGTNNYIWSKKPNDYKICPVFHLLIGRVSSKRNNAYCAKCIKIITV